MQCKSLRMPLPSDACMQPLFLSFIFLEVMGIIQFFSAPFPHMLGADASSAGTSLRIHYQVSLGVSEGSQGA